MRKNLDELDAIYRAEPDRNPPSTAPEHARIDGTGPKTAQFTSDAFQSAVIVVRAAHAAWEALITSHERWMVGKNKKRKPALNAPVNVVEEFARYVTLRDAASSAYSKALLKDKAGVAAGNPIVMDAVIDEGIVPMTMSAADFKQITDEWAALLADPAKKDRVRMADRANGETLSLKQAAARIAKWKAHVRKQAGLYRKENHQRTVLSLFDLTGEWSRPWEEAGYNVIRFDIQSGQDVFDFCVEYFTENYDLTDVYAILAATPCTDFASSGARHFLAKDLTGQTEQSVALVQQTLRTIEYFRPQIWALENPVGRIQNLTGLPDQRLSFDPSHFGDPYTKQTIIWGRFNADLPSANVIPTEGSKMHRLYGGKSQATKNARSETPEGFSYAFFMANNYIDMPVDMKLTAQYPEASGAITQALKVGISEQSIHDLMEDTYGNYEYEAARNALVHAVALICCDSEAVVADREGFPSCLPIQDEVGTIGANRTRSRTPHTTTTANAVAVLPTASPRQARVEIGAVANLRRGSA